MLTIKVSKKKLFLLGGLLVIGLLLIAGAYWFKQYAQEQESKSIIETRKALEKQAVWRAVVRPLDGDLKVVGVHNNIFYVYFRDTNELAGFTPGLVDPSLDSIKLNQPLDFWSDDEYLYWMEESKPGVLRVYKFGNGLLKTGVRDIPLGKVAEDMLITHVRRVGDRLFIAGVNKEVRNIPEVDPEGEVTKFPDWWGMLVVVDSFWEKPRVEFSKTFDFTIYQVVPLDLQNVILADTHVSVISASYLFNMDTKHVQELECDARLQFVSSNLPLGEIVTPEIAGTYEKDNCPYSEGIYRFELVKSGSAKKGQREQALKYINLARWEDYSTKDVVDVSLIRVDKKYYLTRVVRGETWWDYSIEFYQYSPETHKKKLLTQEHLNSFDYLQFRGISQDGEIIYQVDDTTLVYFTLMLL